MADRVALIAGGVRGIGRATAAALAQKGWRVAATFRNSEQDALSLQAELREPGGRFLTVRADVSDPRDSEKLVRRVEDEWGKIDALINCVGPYRRISILEENIEDWRAVFDSNLHPLFCLSRLVIPGMKARGWGRIIGFSVANADRMVGQPYITAYYTAKAGVLVLAKSLAKALAPYGITVNTVSPGIIDTGSIPLEEFSSLVKNIPAGYVGAPRDAAEVVCFLLSDEARYVNGANIHVSGGWGV